MPPSPGPGKLIVRNEYSAAVQVYDNGVHLGGVQPGTGYKWELAIGNHTIGLNTSATALSFTVTDGERLNLLVDAAGNPGPQ
ncbi:MAG: hypothetical protein L0216_15585 [Planctomycetales bacterium]|nr:hypothetical protein [Planctomycetales bacterium]